MKKVGLIFGGLSNESQVSIVSAKNIAKNFDYQKNKLSLVYWHKDGRAYLIEDINKLSKKRFVPIEKFKKLFDVILPVTHGRYGEDGYLQGLLETLKIKYCGCRVLSSALCMDKAVFKTFVAGQNILQTKLRNKDKKNLIILLCDKLKRHMKKWSIKWVICKN